MQNSKKAFTLIEALFAVVILSFMGMTLLQTISNNSKAIEHTHKKSSFMHLFSIFALNTNESLHNTQKSYAEILTDKYQLDDEMRELLKQKEYRFKRKEFNTISSPQTNFSYDTLILTIYKNTIDGDFGAYCYTILENTQ